MRRSGGSTQRVVLSEEARERQQIRDMALVLQESSPVAACQVLASKSPASSKLAVELLSHLLPRQLENRCMLSGSRIDILCTNMSPFPSMKGQPCLVRPKNVPGRLAGVCSGIGM
jgi:hypothetical protein